MGNLKRKGASIFLTDWALAQYLLFRGLGFEEIVRIKPHEHIWVVHDPEHEADDFAMDFVHSESAGYYEAGRLMQRLIKMFCSPSPQAREAIDAAMAEGIHALKRFHKPRPRRPER